ncbi:unnamed protein product [Rotaria magnacalcarata]|uniref:Citrate transport protein n=2 Tax=Rotaria magnacalcarata TaxID=392030 RepID=A0A814T4R6_9BILA|nr:unnamed protein product [Rotaria magnacalcarata]CAF1541781.1 unnamed protein product [Rotaria magnacalcarata]CAF2105175.1 unnamed protein product [Rotaria magnacalcarata]CAF2149422.1 unnamed protein product [Rotaria magnacalcarata]CAF3916815.1 unnamed protein product [Rotaria magnacalcarata]
MNEWDRSSQLFISAVIGVSRTIGGLPLEHPLDTIRTRWQANPTQSRNALQVIREIYASKGFLGFYSGAIPNTTRRAVKQTYRWPMMLFFPNFYRDHVLSVRVYQNYPRLPKILTGLSIANFEILVINPLERLKVWLMTSPTRISLLEFFRQRAGSRDIVLELYRGTSAIFFRQNISWVTFLYTDELTKTKFREYKQSQDLTHVDLFLAGMIVGLVNTAAMMPFDYVKTQKQKYFQNNQSMIGIFQTTLKQEGIGRFYVGWKIYLVQYAIVAILTVNVLDRLEQTFKNSSNNKS